MVVVVVVVVVVIVVALVAGVDGNGDSDVVVAGVVVDVGVALHFKTFLRVDLCN